MLVNKAYKFRLYPSIDQEILINKTFGCTRLIYNNMLNEVRKDNSLSRFDMNKLIPSLYLEYPFLKEVDSCSLRCSVFDLINGLNKYNSNLGEYPKFKKKGVKSSYRTNYIKNTYKSTTYENIKIDLKRKVITLPKLKEVKIRGYRNLKEISGRIINATISKVGHKYYVSVCVSEDIKLPIKKEINVVGIDLGVKEIVVTSDGEIYKNPKYINKYENRIKKLSKRLSRKVKNSKNYNKTKMQIEEVYRKLRNARRKLSENIVNEIVKNNDIIITEKLKVKEMLESKKNKKSLKKEISNVTFSEIIRKLEYKCKWLNKIFIQVSPYYPSSQICSMCGCKDKRMKDLSKREYKCKYCKNEIDRDLNASINIMYEGIINYIKNKIETV